MPVCRPAVHAPAAADPVLAARLEAVTSLARHVAGPVIVIGRDSSVLYASSAARAVLARRAGAPGREAAAGLYNKRKTYGLDRALQPPPCPSPGDPQDLS
jgi:hypothetical protein